MIKVWRAEPRREICQSNWIGRLESCCMIHATDALMARTVECWQNAMQNCQVAQRYVLGGERREEESR